MRGRVGRGVLVGLYLGLALVAVLIWLPAAGEPGFHWVMTDPVVVMGLPMIVVCAAVGAVVGALWSPRTVPDAGGRGAAAGSPSSSAGSRARVVLVAVAVIALVLWFVLGATGLV